jgi:LAGLIDADG endonuclease
LGEFIEGEGSLTISIVRYKNSPYGFLIQPEFNVAQHKKGINILKVFKILFESKGNILKKSGSENVWVYSLKGVSNLYKYFVPFFSKYVIMYSSKYNKNEFKKFVYILNTLIRKPKLNKDEFKNLVKLIYDLNPDGKGKKRKRTLLEVLTNINEVSCENL